MATLIGDEEGNIEANEAMSKEKEEAKKESFYTQQEREISR